MKLEEVIERLEKRKKHVERLCARQTVGIVKALHSREINTLNQVLELLKEVDKEGN